MTRPACIRCSQIGIPCHYPPPSVPPRVSGPQDVQALLDLPTPSSSAPAASSATTAPGQGPLAGGLSPARPDSMIPDGVADNLSWAMEPDSMRVALSESGPQQIPSSSQQPNTTLDPFSALSSAASWNPFTPNMDLLPRSLGENSLSPPRSLPLLQWNNDFTSLIDSVNTGMALSGGTLSDPADPLSSSLRPLSEISNPLGSLETPAPASSAGETLITPRGYPPSSSVSMDGIRRDNATRVDASNSLHTSVASSSSDPPKLIFAHGFTPKLGPLTERESANLYQELFAVLRGYPGLILERDFWSPFVHHQFYRCSLGGMAEPLGVALACVSAYASAISVESSYAFVDCMINQEREKLVRNFRAHIDMPETCLAALHAVCIYQVIGLFGDNFAPAAIVRTPSSEETEHRRRREAERAAELHSSFLLKVGPVVLRIPPRFFFFSVSANLQKDDSPPVQHAARSTPGRISR